MAEAIESFELQTVKTILNRRRRPHPSGGETRTKQSEAELTDVNVIVARHRKTGTVNHLNGRVPAYGDFTHANNLLDAHLEVQEARDMFYELPADVRRAAENDPIRLLEMLAREEDTRVLVEAGLDATLIERDNASPEAAEASSEATPAPPPAASPGVSDQGST